MSESSRTIDPKTVRPAWYGRQDHQKNYFRWARNVPAPQPTQRRHLGNFFAKLQRGEDVTVAFLGGSITWGGNALPIDKFSYRAKLTQWLRKRYPQSNITSINAGMGGTPSRLGAFRTDTQVIDHGADLCLVEFCCNDGGTVKAGHGDQVRENMEAIVRKCLKAGTDVVVFCVAVPDPKLDFSNHLAVAEHYDVPFIDLETWVHEQIEQGRFAYDDDFADGHADVHPNRFGHSVYAERIAAHFMQHETQPKYKPPRLPKAMTPNRLEKVTMVPITKDNVVDWNGWKRESTRRYGPWLGNISTTKPYKSEWPFPYRDGIVRVTEPGKPLKVNFTGKVFGFWGPGAADGGMVRVVVDGKELGTKDLCCPWAAEPCGPGGWSVFSIELRGGKHVAELTVLEESNDQSKGHRAEIGYLLVEK